MGELYDQHNSCWFTAKARSVYIGHACFSGNHKEITLGGFHLSVFHQIRTTCLYTYSWDVGRWKEMKVLQRGNVIINQRSPILSLPLSLQVSVFISLALASISLPGCLCLCVSLPLALSLPLGLCLCTSIYLHLHISISLYLHAISPRFGNHFLRRFCVWFQENLKGLSIDGICSLIENVNLSSTFAYLFSDLYFIQY